MAGLARLFSPAARPPGTPGDGGPRSKPGHLAVATWNAEALCSSVQRPAQRSAKRAFTLEMVRQNKPQVLAIQETHGSYEDMLGLLRPLVATHEFFVATPIDGATRLGGVAVIVRRDWLPAGFSTDPELDRGAGEGHLVCVNPLDAFVWETLVPGRVLRVEKLVEGAVLHYLEYP